MGRYMELDIILELGDEMIPDVGELSYVIFPSSLSHKRTKRKR